MENASNKAVNFTILLFLIGTLFLTCYDPFWVGAAFISTLVGAGAIKAYREELEANKNEPVPMDYTIDVMAYKNELAKILEPLRGTGKFDDSKKALPYHTFRVEVDEHAASRGPEVKYNCYCEHFEHCFADTPDKALELMGLEVKKWQIQNNKI